MRPGPVQLGLTWVLVVSSAGAAYGQSWKPIFWKAKSITDVIEQGFELKSVVRDPGDGRYYYFLQKDALLVQCIEDKVQGQFFACSVLADE